MNDKLNKEIKENDNELTAVESNKEEAVVEEVTAEASEQKNEEKKKFLKALNTKNHLSELNQTVVGVLSVV